MEIKVYSIASCIASNDFITWCEEHSLNYIATKVYDSQFPQIAYSITHEQLEEKYSRRFYQYPVIFINGALVPSISKAKEIIFES